MKRAKVVSVFAGIAAMSAGLLIEVKRIDENLLGKKRKTKRMLLVRVSLYSILCVCQHVELRFHKGAASDSDYLLTLFALLWVLI